MVTYQLEGLQVPIKNTSNCVATLLALVKKAKFEKTNPLEWVF
jgi:hypothetical protein